jgi:hypothetical protein
LRNGSIGIMTRLTTSIVGGLAIRPHIYAMRGSAKICGIIPPGLLCPPLQLFLLVTPLGAEGEGGKGEGGAEEEEVAAALFKLGAGGPLMDRGSSMMD